MAAVIKPLMSGQGAPWVLYGIGAIIALVLDRCKVPALAFAVGYVHTFRAEHPALSGRRSQLVRDNSL